LLSFFPGKTLVAMYTISVKLLSDIKPRMSIDAALAQIGRLRSIDQEPILNPKEPL
jgi:hypothetical protein